MPISAKHFLVAKDGSPADQNEDAAAANPVHGRFAIADGATESGFSRIWSRLMVEEFALHSDGPADDWSKWLPTAQQRWLDELKKIKIPWYGEKQFQLGAFATMLGVVLTGDEDGFRWLAVAVGDSCLFHTRDGQLLQSFPLVRSSQFDSTPRLVGSRSSVAEIAEKRSLSERGTARRHDRMWLTSDALAQWCLAECEANRPPWDELAEFFRDTGSDDAFVAWVKVARDDRGLHNDDVALMAIEGFEGFPKSS